MFCVASEATLKLLRKLQRLFWLSHTIGISHTLTETAQRFIFYLKQCHN